MRSFVPMGYITVHDSLNCLGRELFRSQWTGEELKARPGLVSETEWPKIKDQPLPMGSGSTGTGRGAAAPEAAPKKAATPHPTGDPSDPSYQAEYRAYERYEAACYELRVRLEAGRLEAVILDPFRGTIHRARISLWRQHNADRIISKGEAPIPHTDMTGSFFIKAFADTSGYPKPPIPATKIREAIDLLKKNNASESLTRPQQTEFVRATFQDFHVTERQMHQIFQEIPVSIGRPKNSDKKV